MQSFRSLRWCTSPDCSGDLLEPREMVHVPGHDSDDQDDDGGDYEQQMDKF